MTEIPKDAPTQLPAGWDRLPRMLLAEDDDELRKLLLERFRSAGFEVIEAEDGTTVLECLADSILNMDRGSSFDLIVSDIRMPGFTAFHILKSARGALKSTPVILITAFADAATHNQARSLGAAAIFDKPVDVDDLLRAACALLPPPQARP
jgi:CheY-like chemotaxis protein